MTSYRFGPFLLQPQTRSLFRDAFVVPLTARAFDLLVEARDRVVPRDEFLERLWGDVVVEDNNLSQQITKVRRTLGPMASGQSWIATVPGRGFQFVGPVAIGDQPPVTPAPPSSWPTSVWPTVADPLLGRDDDLAAIGAMLQRHAIVTLTGPGGVGKTRLAVEIGRQYRAAGGLGACWIDLTRATRPDDVLPLLAAAIGLADTGKRPLLARVQDWLRDREPLLVFDNFEHVLAAAPLLPALVPGPDGVRVLATSRASLSLRGEHEYRLDPLPWAPADPRSNGNGLAASPAVVLFVDRVRARAGDAVADAMNAREVSALCERLDGLPLAIELAAARVPLLAVSDLLHREHIVAVLPEGPRDAPARQQSLQRTLEWSYDLLAPRERAAARALAVFTGGFTAAAAASVLVETGVACDECAALDLVEMLRRHSLLSLDDAPAGSSRIRMLETVREFCQSLAPDDEAAATRAAHAGWVQRLFARESPRLRTGQNLAAMQCLVAEEGNLQSALRWSSDEGATRDQAGLATAALFFWHSATRFIDTRTWVTRAIRSARASGDLLPALWCRLLAAGAFIAFFYTAFDEVTALAAETVAVGGDPFSVVLAECLRGAALTHAGRLADAGAVLDAVLASARELGDSWLQAFAALMDSHRATLAGDYANAYDSLQGPPRGLGLLDDWIVVTLGLDAVLLDRLELAARYFAAALAQQYGTYTPIRQVAAAFEGLGYVCARRGRHESATLLLATADRWRRETSPLFTAWAAEHDRAISTVREALGARFERLWADGAAMSFDDARALASEMAAIP